MSNKKDRRQGGTGKLIKVLIEFGLNKAQARLYVAGLKTKKALMAQLAREAGVKRTTAYYLMDELLRRRFFATKRFGRRTYYIAITSKQLWQLAKEKERLIRQILPTLKTIEKS